MLRSEVVGSLLRPDYLKEARELFAAGKLTDGEFKHAEDRAVDESIKLQIQAGVDVITDGEMRRYAFYGHLIDSVEGFDKYGGWAIPFRNEKGEQLVLPRPVVVSRLRRKSVAYSTYEASLPRLAVRYNPSDGDLLRVRGRIF